MVLESWLPCDASSDFSLQNIPFGVCSKKAVSVKHSDETRPRCCTAIGNHVVDLFALAEAGLFEQVEKKCNFHSVHAFSQTTLNAFMSYQRPVWVAVRERLQELFAKGGSDDLSSNEALKAKSLWVLSGTDEYTVETHMPANIGDYTDFYSSRNHATNVGIMFRGKDNALQPNWLHLPVGYHGRASSVVVSSEDAAKNGIRRPCGQLQKDANDPSQGSTFGACRLLDFELEMAFFVGGPSNKLGRPLSMEEAKERIFGYVLMNDWSARDIQKWEYVPLGPFGAKNFATTISPWIVTPMALEPFECMPSGGPQVDPAPLEYLQDDEYEKNGAYDIQLFVKIQGETMEKSEQVCHSNYKHMYWTPRQQLVHHAVTGCNMNPGDLLGSGTISGTDDSAFGSMLELSWKGSKEVKLGNSGEIRKFLKDGDTVRVEGYCQKEGLPRVGFGHCMGKILPALSSTSAGDKDESLVQAPRFSDFKLYNYWRSSSSWRVRIAFAAKNVPFEYVPVNILQGEHKGEDHTKRNPKGQVPVLEFLDQITGKTIQITQSLAIMNFIEQAFPEQGGKLLPSDPLTCALATEVAEVINAGIQPLQNMGHVKNMETLSNGIIDGNELSKDLNAKGLQALEALIKQRVPRQDDDAVGPFICGTFSPTIADACLVPQMYNARRFGIDVETLCPSLCRAEQSALKHPWFIVSHPQQQSDTVAE